MVKMRERHNLDKQTGPYINDIEGVDISCLKCGEIFPIGINANVNSNSIQGCTNCLTRHTTFINDGTIMVDAYWHDIKRMTRPNYIPKRHKISFLEWSCH